MARGASFSDELAQLELSLSEEERQRVVSRVDGEDVDVEVLRRNVQWAARQQGLKIKPRALLLRAPKLMCSPAHELQVWYDFFTSYGFDDEQFRHVLANAPAALEKATLVSAGLAMVDLKALGLDERAIVQLIVVWPEVLHMDSAQVRELVDVMIARHQSTHGC